jgi:hypothetical protein
LRVVRVHGCLRCRGRGQFRLVPLKLNLITNAGEQRMVDQICARRVEDTGGAETDCP